MEQFKGDGRPQFFVGDPQDYMTSETVHQTQSGHGWTILSVVTFVGIVGGAAVLSGTVELPEFEQQNGEEAGAVRSSDADVQNPDTRLFTALEDLTPEEWAQMTPEEKLRAANDIYFGDYDFDHFDELVENGKLGELEEDLNSFINDIEEDLENEIEALKNISEDESIPQSRKNADIDYIKEAIKDHKENLTIAKQVKRLYGF